jgi:hypothetical protein
VLNRHNWEFRSEKEARNAAASYFNAGLRDYKMGNRIRAIRWWKLAYKVTWIDEDNNLKEVGSPQAAVALGKLSMLKHDYTAATLHFEWAYKLGSSEALIQLAKISVIKKDVTNAMKLLRIAINNGRQDALRIYKELQATREEGAL